MRKFILISVLLSLLIIPMKAEAQFPWNTKLLIMQMISDSLQTIDSDSITVNFLFVDTLGAKNDTIWIISRVVTRESFAALGINVDTLRAFDNSRIQVGDTLEVIVPIMTNDIMAYSGDRIDIPDSLLIDNYLKAIYLKITGYIDADSMWGLDTLSTATLKALLTYTDELKAATNNRTISAKDTFDLDYTSANMVAVIDGNKMLIADANISTTELGYLDNVSSAIQTQLDAKTGIADDETITGKWEFQKSVHISGDTLIITDATGADSLLIYNDGDTVRFESNGIPLKFGTNSLIIGDDGLVVIDSSAFEGRVWFGANSVTDFAGDVDFNSGIEADSIDLVGETLPFWELDITDFYADADWYPHADYKDTLMVTADDSTFRGGYYPGMIARARDSVDTDNDGHFDELQTADMVYNLELSKCPWFIGVDSIVTDGITNCGVDSANYKVEAWLNDGNGGLTLMDSTTAIASNGTWLHDNSITTLSALGRYGRMKLVIRFQSIDYDCVITVGRIRIYFEKAS